MISSSFEPLGLAPVQRRRKLALFVAGLCAIAMLPLVRSSSDDSLLHEFVEFLGILFIAVAVIGRCWCALYIGGRKAHEIVAMGPYSLCRNPLYVFSIIGVAGLGAQTGTASLAVLLALVAIAIFVPVVLKEEQALLRRFGADYVSYLARVPRFWPRFSAWRDEAVVVASPRRFVVTAREGLLLLLAYPLCEAIDWLQNTGFVVPLVHLP